MTQSLRKAVTSARSNYLERIERQKKLIKSLREEEEVTKKDDDDSLAIQRHLLDAEGLLDELGRKLLTEGCSKMDMNKINAANAIVMKSQEMKKSATEKKEKLKQGKQSQKKKIADLI